MNTSEKSSKYYDKNILDMEKSEHRYEELYINACRILTDSKINIDEPIIDLGCGIGSFAKFLKTLNYKKYIGIDFSEKSIIKAKERFPDYEFICGNLKIILTDKICKKMMKNGKVFVCFEVLEHIENDKEIIKLLPDNSLLIFSVPNISGHGHVRWFNNMQEVEDRYKDVLIFTEEKIEITKKGKPHHKLFLFKTYKRENL